MNSLQNRSRVVASFFLILTGLSPGRAEIVINEVVTAGSDRLVRWVGGIPRIGTGTPWHAGAYNDGHWASGPGPFGFDTTAPAGFAVGTNTLTRMQYLTPTLYLRKAFTVTAAQAAQADPLELLAQYNDGFIVYVNGVELARRWAGPPNQVHYHDQPAMDPDFNNTTGDSALSSETVNLGAANARLVAGQNVIAVHALNTSSIQGVFLFSGNVRIGGATPTTLINANDTWKYFPGVVEPSGGLYDPTRLDSGRLSVPWGTAAYADTGWSEGSGPIGQGAAGVNTSVTGIVGVTPSLYTRKVFAVSAAEAANTQPLQILVDYDDAFVAYLNGVEVGRANLQTPNTFVPRTGVSSATRNFGSGNQTITIEPNVAKLIAGNNVLAVQVHNVSIGDSDIAVRTTLQRQGAAVPLVASTSPWKYKIGTEEPVVDLDGAIEDSPDQPESVTDWVELHNNGAADVSLKDWSLTDDNSDPTKWLFPDVTIPAGGYLVVICDGENIVNPAFGGFLHANFSLGANGEHLALRNAAGTVVQQFSPRLPAISPFHSYGRNAANNFVHFDVTTPGAPNAGSQSQGLAAAPTFSVPGGIYGGTQSVQLSTLTPGATIRYTTDGSEPTETTGFPYTAPLSVTTAGGRNGRVYRARTFAPGYVASPTTTHTYLIALNPAATLPIVALSADEPQSLYRPFGVFAVKNNTSANFTDGPWRALGDPLQYNNTNLRGRFMERPVNWQMIYPLNAPGFSIEFGLRAAGSPYTRPRYELRPQNALTNPNSGAWASQVDRPSMNFYMRDDLSGDPLDFPVISGSPVTKHSDFRFRAGHNDLNPFIIDELMRRLHVGTGQQGSLGVNVSLYINGVYKNIYNLCQHVREEFLQQAYNSDLDWDVLQVAIASDGDLIAFQELFTFLRNNNQSVLANYAGAQARIDLVNFADYLLVNIYGATGDWPHNNWIAARERSVSAKWRFFTWDAEGAFGAFGKNSRSNCFATYIPDGDSHAILVTPNVQTESMSNAARVLYSLLRDSPEFKLLMADRIQKHFFNGGVLTNAAILARNTTLTNEASPFIGGYDGSRIPNWVNGTGTNTTLPAGQVASYNTSTGATPSRRQALFDGYVNATGGTFPAHFVSEGIWPATKAPVFSQHGGAMPANFQLTITSPGGAGSVYYTLNGSDPRGAGGTVNGTPYSGPVTLNQTLTVKARVRTAAGLWSPLTEALFVSSATAPLLITEVMYHPPDFNDAGTLVNGSEFEFIELKNVSAQPYDLFGMRFTDGIDYAFPAGSSIPANGFVVLAKNPGMFAKKYPNVPVLGAYGPSSSLSNGGEVVTLADGALNPILTMMYDDTAPWPIDADGNGYSLVPMFPNTNPNPSDAVNWRLSGSVNGSPMADDPAPGIPQIRITEVLANSQPPAVDAIELFNPGAGDAMIGGWFLSDDLGTPKKFRIPDNTVIPAGGYAVFTENQFNTGINAFALSSNGDEAVLSSADAAGQLTGLTEFVSFGASETGVSFGRHTVVKTGKQFFTAMRENTFGLANTGPRVGTLVLTEVSYLPGSSKPEFIELRNNGSGPLPLFDPANPSNRWRISGVNFTFPPGITLQPGQFVVVSANDPTLFRNSYPVPAAVLVVGPFQPDDLSNAGERLALQKPGDPYLGSSGQTLVPFYDMDFVTYGTASPWPTLVSGRTMERDDLFGFGEDPDSWRSSASSDGNIGRFSPMNFANWQTTQWFVGQPAMQGHFADPDGDGLVNALEFAMGLNPRVRDGGNAVNSGTTLVGAAGPYLTISFPQSLSTINLSLGVEVSSDLLTWAALPPASQVSVTTNGNGTQTIVYRDTVEMTADVRRFLRVKASVQ